MVTIHFNQFTMGYQSYDSYDSDIWIDFGNIADGDWDAGIKECAGIVWNPG